MIRLYQRVFILDSLSYYRAKTEQLKSETKLTVKIKTHKKFELLVIEEYKTCTVLGEERLKRIF